MEEVIGDLNQRLVGAIVVASVAAAVVERAMLGGRPSLAVPAYSLGDWRELFAYALLGLLAGLGATVFVRGLLGLRTFVRGLTRLPVWARPAAGGAIMAAIGLAMPQTFGIGYPTLSAALLGQLSWPRMVLLSAGKLAATVTSYGWGLSGGIFAPSLCSLARPSADPSRTWSTRLPGRPPTPSGPSRWSAWARSSPEPIRAPITSILIIFEMTGDYAIILPLMISNVISYTVAARLHPVPIYDALLRQDGVPVPEHQTHRDLRGLTVEQAMRTDLPLVRVSGTIGEAAGQLENSAARILAVVDDEGRLQGVVGRRELTTAGALVGDVARHDVVTVFPDQSLDLALLKLGRHSVRQAPVVTRAAPALVVGMLSLEDISAAVERSHG